MTFPGGTVSIPDALTCNGTSGAQQLWPAEQPRALDRLTDDQLERLSLDMLTLMDTEDPDELSPGLADYIMLLTTQLQDEIQRRS